jgi:hypothetical protein
MREFLDTVLPPSKIAADLMQILSEATYTVELDGATVTIPRDVPLSVVSRSAHAYEYAIGFGDHLRALVAIGGVQDISYGVPVAGVCFATLWYSIEAKVITVDFCSGMP